MSSPVSPAFSASSASGPRRAAGARPPARRASRRRASRRRTSCTSPPCWSTRAGSSRGGTRSCGRPASSTCSTTSASRTAWPRAASRSCTASSATRAGPTRPCTTTTATASRVADVDGDGLLDLYFVTQVGANGLWRNLGEGRFEDVTAAAGVGVADRIGVTASFADIDNDGDPDLYVTTVRGGNILFENDGAGTFRDITAAAGLGYVGHSSGAVFFDYDRDGRLDLFLTNVGVYTTDMIGGDGYRYYVGFEEDAFRGHLFPERTERSLLFRNEGGSRFADVSEATGLVDRRWSGDATPLDVNDDGWTDLYVLNMQGDDEYYENLGGTRFAARGRDVFPRTSWGAMGVAVLDFNNDGRLDIYVTDMHSDMSQEVGPADEKRKAVMIWDREMVGDGSTSLWGNAFFLNLGSGRFREVSDEIGAENYWPWGPSAGDLNADGYEDLFVASSMNFPFRYGVNSVLLNNAGTRFLDAEFILGVEPRAGGLTTPWFELGEDDRLPTFTGTPRDVTVMARARLALVGHLRPRRRRRPRHRDLGVQRRPHGARQRPRGAERHPLPEGAADGDRLEPRRPRCPRPGHGRRPDLHAAPRREVGLPVAELDAALLRPRRRRLGRAHRRAVAVGDGADGRGPARRQHPDRGGRGVAQLPPAPRPRP